MKPKRILLWLICATLVYNIYGYTKQHTSGDVLAYKRLASALVENDTAAVQKILIDEKDDMLLLAGAQQEQKELIGDSSVLFTYYVIKKQRYSHDGNTSHILAEQIFRVNPPGAKAIIGENEVRVRHNVQLVKQDNAWYVKAFENPTAVQ